VPLEARFKRKERKERKEREGVRARSIYRGPARYNNVTMPIDRLEMNRGNGLRRPIQESTFPFFASFAALCV
jgi:hypothetical protein